MIRRGRETADLSTALRSGRDDKGEAGVSRNGGYGKNRPQISPLRCAPVEMTKGRAVVIRNDGYGKNRPQISPLRCAPVEMTKGTPA